jgi:hypothetical protein
MPYPSGVEPRIKLGPALKQADALPTETHRTMSESCQIITEPRCTICSAVKVVVDFVGWRVVKDGSRGEGRVVILVLP